MHAVIPYLTAALLFGLGVYGVLRRRNAVLVLMAVELMLNAVNLILVTADATVRAAVTGSRAVGTHVGGVAVLFVIVLAAAEVGVGLAIVLQYYRMRAGVAVTDVLLETGGNAAEPDAPAGRNAAAPDAPTGGDRPAGSDRSAGSDRPAGSAKEGVAR